MDFTVLTDITAVFVLSFNLLGLASDPSSCIEPLVFESILLLLLCAQGRSQRDKGKCPPPLYSVLTTKDYTYV